MEHDKAFEFSQVQTDLMEIDGRIYKRGKKTLECRDID